jgi:hypothetical protein
MKLTKYLVFLAAVAGVVGVFLPTYANVPRTLADVLASSDLSTEAGQGMLIAMSPMAGMVLLSLLAIGTRLSRVLAFVVVACGAASGWFWWDSWGGFVTGEIAAIGTGGWMMAAPSAGGVLFGLLAMIKPEPTVDEKKPKKDQKKKDKKD